MTTRQCTVPADLVLASRPRPAGDGRLRTPGAIDAAGLYDSGTLIPESPVDVETLGRRLAAMPGVLRAKGFLRDLSGGRRLLQVVPGQWEVADAPAVAADGLVVVTRRGASDLATLQRWVEAGCPD